MVRMTPVPWVTLQDEVPEEVLMTLLDTNGDRWKGTRIFEMNRKDMANCVKE